MSRGNRAADGHSEGVAPVLNGRRTEHGLSRRVTLRRARDFPGIGGSVTRGRRWATQLMITSISVLCALGCDGQTPSAGAPLVTDSAGVRVVTNRAPSWTDANAWRLASQPRVTVGRPDGDDAQQLYQVAGALVVGDRIAIANAGTHELRFYTADGRFLTRVGGEGDGPGEFRRIASLHRMGGDSLAVIDLFSRTVTVFDTAGGFGRTVRLRAPQG